MIVGAYTLDLYCDDQETRTRRYQESESDDLHEWDEFPHQFVGETFADTVRDARKAGWIINVIDGVCYCPKCAKKRRRRRQTDD